MLVRQIRYYAVHNIIKQYDLWATFAELAQASHLFGLKIYEMMGHIDFISPQYYILFL
ncbi:unnamed protein product [Lupinus luteus]|uniref:Uncharacterized protein n=1 Tax=Lupinus luteus TaxID=3873 RepID=A0AAV1XCT6_LUPLU